MFKPLTNFGELAISSYLGKFKQRHSVILSVLDPRKCEYLEDYLLDFEHAYMTIYLAS